MKAQMTAPATEPTTSDTHLEQALYYAFRLVEKMEESAPGSQLIFLPAVVAWVIEQLKPALLEALREPGQFEDFLKCLELYQSLRPEAAEINFQTFSDGCDEMCIIVPYDGCVTPMDMLEALERNARTIAVTRQRALFERVLHQLQERGPTRGRSHASASAALPGIVHQYSAENDLDELMQMDDRRAVDACLVASMRHARRELLSCDNGTDPAFWQKTYPEVVTKWLELDLPETAAQIQREDAVRDYVNDVTQFREQMMNVERLWTGVSHPVRALLLRCADEQKALNIVAAIVRAGKTEERDVCYCASLVWSMIKRRETYTGERVTKVDQCTDRNEYIDGIRASDTANDICFVTATNSLPANMKAVIEETDVLVVRMPEAGLHDIDLLSKPLELRPFFSRDIDTKKFRRELTMTNALWCEYEQLWPIVFAFRRHIPVVYTFRDICVVCQYPFDHFSDLRYVGDLHPRHYPTTDVASDGTCEGYGPAKRGRIRIRPVVIKSVVDESAYRNVGELSKAFVAERSATECEQAARR
jgi:hypothetical protein